MLLLTLILPIWGIGQIIIVNGVTIDIDYDNDRICIDIYECNRCLLGGITQSDICECDGNAVQNHIIKNFMIV